MWVELDTGTKQLTNHLLFGGRPQRLMRLSPDGANAYDELVEGVARTPQAVVLARRMIDAGMAHPIPKPVDNVDRVTIVIPAYNRSAEIAEVLNGLAQSAPGVRVVVVDDASTRASLRALSRICDRYGAQLVIHLHNRGPAAARNTGL